MREGSSFPASAYARRNKHSQSWEENMEVTRGISIRGRETTRCSSVTQKHICLHRVRVRLTYTHTEMHGQHDVYTHCCELEEMRKRRVCSETQASRPSGLAGCGAEQRGAGARATVGAVRSSGLTGLLHPALPEPSPPAGTLHTRAPFAARLRRHLN